MARDALALRIVALAQERTKPADIAEELGVTVDTVYARLRAVRLSGIEIPNFTGGREKSSQPTAIGAGPRRPVLPEAQLRNPQFARPRPEPETIVPVAPIWTANDDAELRRLHGRGNGVTRIAALMRKPYRLVIEAAERLGLYEARRQERITS